MHRTDPIPVIIHDLSLTNFRHNEKASFSFDRGLVFIIGNNGAGKTTILEAIGLASFLKSFRFAMDREMIRFGSQFYRIEVGFSRGEAKHSVAIAFGRNPNATQAAVVKKYSLDGRTDTKAAAIIGKIPVVVLSPDDLRIIGGEHSERRRFLDLMLSMLYPAYFAALQRYQRALKLRSQTLKNKPDEALLNAVDRELAEAGFNILEKRRQFIPEFSEPFAENIAKISAGRDAWQIVYRGDTEQVTSVADYLTMLREHRARDLRLRQTTSGIHRDRLFFLLEHEQNHAASADQAPSMEHGRRPGLHASADQAPSMEHDIRIVGSQGQKRTAALALKMAQFTYMQNKLGMRPVLLIDDVLNELDLQRRASFVDFLGTGGQVFFTTTDLVGMQDFLQNLQQSVPVQIIEL